MKYDQIKKIDNFYFWYCRFRKIITYIKTYEYYTKNGAFTAVLNLDPGVENIPYTCDVDVRDYVDIVSIMQQYDLGPNGAIVMANDLDCIKN